MGVEIPIVATEEIIEEAGTNDIRIWSDYITALKQMKNGPLRV